MQSWTIGILCYNEENSIYKVINDVVVLLHQISPTDNEIVIVDDGSTDNTGAILREIASKYSNVQVITHHTNLGIGQAILSAHEAATKENLCVISGDGETNIDELIPYSVIEKNTFISFYRKENTTYNVKRNVLSYFNKVYNKVFLGINLKDVNWTKIYKTQDVKNLDLKLTSSLVESEICFKLLKKGNKVIEVPSQYLERMGGESKGANRKIVLQALSEMFKLFLESLRVRLFHK